MLLGLVSSCSKDTFDEYYGRPESLEDPIFQQLEARGNFKNLTALIEKAGYKDILSKSGYWTMMAPNDEAFNTYFQANGISDISKIDTETANKIVRYALIYNAFRLDQLSDYQSSKTGWVIDNAFRRRTAFYDGFQTKTIDGKPTVIIGSNRNNRAATGTPFFVTGDSNNKYITYFESEYFTAQNLSTTDYKFFYPNKQYTGANVLGGAMMETDIIAENGTIHEVNEVSLPLVNLDQHLENSSQYSLFHDVLEKYLVTYVFNQDATNTYHNYTGKSDNVYVKVWDNTLPFSPNNENFVKLEDNDGQSDAYTLFAPNNASFEEFIKTVLLKNFTSLDKLPKNIFQDLFKAHAVAHAVWPSKLVSYTNALGEELKFNMNTDIKESKVLSNGFFYGTNKVQASNLFYTVYTSAYLDPKFSMATLLFNDGSGYKEIISNINQKYTLFLPSDELLKRVGFLYDSNHQYFTYTSPNGTITETGTAARTRLMRYLYNGIVPTPNGELNNLSGSGIIRTGDPIIPGEYIKWNNNKVYAFGNEVLGTSVSILGHEDRLNGRTYYIDGILEYSDEWHGLKIQRMAQASGSICTYFFNYLANSTLYTPTGDSKGKINGVNKGTPYTFAIPNNDAIVQAVKDGLLPGNKTTGVPNFVSTTWTQLQKDQVDGFIQRHILIRTVSDDGLSNGLYETLKQNKNLERTTVSVISARGSLTFKDNNKNPLPNRTANFIPASSNNLADRTLIHIVDNYLLYQE